MAKRVEDLDGKISEASKVIENVKEATTTKIDELKNELNQGREKIESVTGAFDSNNDGRVSLQEAKEIAAANPDQWTDVNFWFQLLLAILGITVTGKVTSKGGTALLASLHKKGRQELAKNGQPSLNDRNTS